MYSPTTINDFLHLVRESGLIEARLLNVHLERIRNGDTLLVEPRDLAENLLRARLLTPYQAEQLLLGNWRGFTIAKYTILDRLGSGSTGSVYLCEQPAMRRKVAIKVLPFITDAAPSTVQRFRREARALAALDHPNVVHVHDFDQEGEQLFLVMEYIDGISLQDLVKKTGPLDALHGAHYMRQAAKGLQHLHEAGLVHRDMKPGNLMLDAKGTVKILDLGLARPLDEENEGLTAKYDPHRVLGTADYLAPEQAINSHEVDIRADIYGLGATFYFLLTGCTPFNNGTVVQKLLWVQTREPTPLRELSPDVAEGLAEVVAKMMAKDPSQRYQTPAEVVHALDSWAQTPIDPPAPELMPKERSRLVPKVPADLTETPAPRKTAPVGVKGVAMPKLEGKGSPEVPARLLYPRLSDARMVLPPAETAIDQPPPPRTGSAQEAARLSQNPPGEEEGRGWLQVIIVVATVALSVGLGIAATLASSWRLF